MGPRFVHLGNHRTTTPFSLGNTRPSERKVVFRRKPSDDDTVFSRLGNTHLSERKVVFRWKPSDDDTVFFWKYATLREKVVFRWKPPDDDTVFSRLGNMRTCPREKSCSVGSSWLVLPAPPSLQTAFEHTAASERLLRFNHLTFPTLLCAFSLSAPPPVPNRTP